MKPGEPTPKPPSTEKQVLAYIAKTIKYDTRNVELLEEIAGHLKRIAEKVDPQ